MLDNYLENNIKKKLHIFSVLQLRKTISIKELSKIVKISPSSILGFLDELNFDFQGLAEINKKASNFQIDIFEGISISDIFHAIYQSSNILNCLRFMINNDDNISFSTFSEEFFLTRPTAYRVRKNCVTYLNEIGLDVDKNRVIGDEYRIRFLIGLLYYKYGIDCCGIDDTSIKLARKFIIATNDKINMDFLEYTSNEYGYFECLLILSWKRLHHSVSFKKSIDLETLKQVFVYSEIKKHLKATIEMDLNITFTEADYDYIYLVYCCTNSCVLADKWTSNDIDLVTSFVFSDPKFKDLIFHFSENFSTSMWQSHAFRSCIIYFYKKCLFNLHCIIPDKHYYLDIQKDAFKNMVFQYVSNTITEWKQRNNIPYPIDDGHLQYLTIQIASIAKQFIKPIQVFLVSDLIAEIEVLKLYLSRSFSDQRILIKQVLFNAEDITFMSSLNNCVIITKKVFAQVLNALNISESNIIVPVNIEINTLDMTAITNAIVRCEHNIFKNLK